MALDRSKMASRRKAAQARRDSKKGGYLTIPEGHNLYYVCPGNEHTDDMPWLEVDIHFKVGPDKKACVCLSPDNPVWKDAAFRDYLKTVNADVEPGECAVCNAVAGNEGFAGGADPEDMAAKTRSLWALAPLAVIRGGQREMLPVEAQVPKLYMGGTKIGDEIVDVLEAEGDITDPTGATLIRISRKGTGFKDTRYQPVTADGETLRTPIKLPKPLRAAVARDCAPGGDCDVAQVVARMARPLATMRALLNGESVQQQSGGGDGKPGCYESDFDPDDDDCVKDCRFGRACAKACGKTFPGDAGKLAPEEAKPKPKAERKPAPAPVVEDEEPEEPEAVEADGFEATPGMVAEVLGALFGGDRKAKDVRALLADVLEETGDGGPEGYTKAGVREWLEASTDDEDLWGELVKLAATLPEPTAQAAKPEAKPKAKPAPAPEPEGDDGEDDELAAFERQLRSASEAK